jgi:hypothetical protein
MLYKPFTRKIITLTHFLSHFSENISARHAQIYTSFGNTCVSLDIYVCALFLVA